ncbi:hypothetical protein GALMADRAFT_236638 [Galerina marginata CBS 339.88]|uniref:Cyclin N-terminal domain-containing protein n=1 Tax=Galerina marginata (strain CBS 339.88) TaxID=685588 RepID=A0A067TLF0_GALM3|nr:hypothetical protein GALMADRAFT_236638 [Galerina marginata CBS 339.88]
MTKNCLAFARYQDIGNSSWTDGLPKYISSIIHRSKLGVSAAISALILGERFQEALRMRQVFFEDKVEDAGRLFLISYMVAAKVIHDERHRLKFWENIAGDQYSRYELFRMESQFYEMVDWRVQINEEEFNRCFVEMMDSYHCYLKQHRLPSGPPPVYQKIQRHEAERKALVMRTEGLDPIPILDEEDEDLFTRALFSPQARRTAEVLKCRWQFFGIALLPPPFS